jgi:hypothetical protein
MGDRPDAITDLRAVERNDRRPIVAFESYFTEGHRRLRYLNHHTEESVSLARISVIESSGLVSARDAARSRQDHVAQRPK